MQQDQDAKSIDQGQPGSPSRGEPQALVMAEVVTYGKLVDDDENGSIVPGFEHAVTSRSGGVKDDVPLLLPSTLLGDRAAEPRQIEPKEAAIAEGGGKPKDHPDGALLVTGIPSLKCFDGNPGVALMRFRFRPELGEGCGGRRYLQARIWLVRFADWRKHAGDILHRASEALAAVPDVARKDDSRFARPVVQLAVNPPAEPDPDAAVSGLVGGQTLAANRFFYMAMVCRLLAKADETDVGTFGGSLIPTEDAFVSMVGHALRQVYAMKSWPAHDGLWLASRLRLAVPGNGLAYLSSREIEPRTVKDAEWEQFKAKLRSAPSARQQPQPPVPVRERELYEFERKPVKAVAQAPASGSPANPPAGDTQQRFAGTSAVLSSRPVAPMTSRNLAVEPLPKQVAGAWSDKWSRLSSDLEGEILEALDTWERCFLAFTANDGNPAVAMKLLLASVPITAFLKSEKFERLLRQPDFANRQSSSWNYFRLVAATGFQRDFAPEFSFRELLGLAPLHYLASRATFETTGQRKILVAFMDGAIRLVMDRILSLEVLWPTEVLAFQHGTIEHFVKYLEDTAKLLGKIRPYQDVMLASEAFSRQWDGGRPGTRLVTGVDDDFCHLGNACKRIIQRHDRAVKHDNRYWEPTALRFPPAASDLTRLDFRRPRTERCPSDEAEIIRHCVDFLFQQEEKRKGERRLSPPQSVPIATR